MLMITALLLAGFVAGVASTALVAFHAYGLLREEAIRIVDTHLAGMSLPATTTMRTVTDG